MNALFWIAVVLVMYNLNKEVHRNIFKEEA
mgnify:FL=1